MSVTVLLAPVPRDHILAAREVAERTGGRVAFGSGANDPGRMWEFFAEKAEPGMEVLIYVSTTGEGEYYGHGFSHRGKFGGVFASERDVLDLRPATAIAGDTGHGCYWVVEEFEQLMKENFVLFGRYGLQGTLRGPKISKMKK